jgi:hypothetical protein
MWTKVLPAEKAYAFIENGIFAIFHPPLFMTIYFKFKLIFNSTDIRLR